MTLWALVSAVAATLLVLAWLAGSRSPTHGVRLRGRWGTIYVFQDAASPELVKVGTTRRLSKQRKREVSRVAAEGAALRQVYAVDMPFAHAVETVAHRRLRRKFRGSSRGREWYVVRDAGEFVNMVRNIESAAWDVRTAAVQRSRWREGADDAARVWRLTPTGPVRDRLFV